MECGNFQIRLRFNITTKNKPEVFFFFLQRKSLKIANQPKSGYIKERKETQFTNQSF